MCGLRGIHLRERLLLRDFFSANPKIKRYNCRTKPHRAFKKSLTGPVIDNFPIAIGVNGGNKSLMVSNAMGQTRRYTWFSLLILRLLLALS